MSTSKTIHSYGHVQNVLEAARLHGGGKYQCTSKSARTKWIQDANSLRILIRKDMAKRNPKIEPVSPYDQFIFRKSKEDDVTVLIEVRAPDGIFIAPDGTHVDLARDEPAPDPNMMAEAEELARSIGLEIDHDS